MPKNGVKISAIAVIRVIVFLFIAYISFAMYTRVQAFMTTDAMFAVKEVMVESSIQFIDTRPLRALKGRNIFDVDIVALRKQLASQYPQITQLRVVRELPDKIKVLAKRRDMVMQAEMNHKFLLIDKEGVAVIYSNNPLALPTVVGLNPKSKFQLGKNITFSSLQQARLIVLKMQQQPLLAQFDISQIDIANPAKITVTLKQIPAKIILDVEHGADKLDVLVMLLAQKKIDLAQIDYVDLRFEQPVMASLTETVPARKK